MQQEKGRPGRERGRGRRLTVLAALMIAGAALLRPGSTHEPQPELALSEIGTGLFPSEDGTRPPASPEGPAGAQFPEMDPDGPLPEIVYNLDRLPEPVRRMHRLIVEAARSGDIEKLRPLVGSGDSGTQLSFGGVEGDPVEYLKGLSGDPEGQEILAILEEILSAGFVHLGAGTPGELYVWPYFYAIPLDRLTPPQRVELFKIVTAGDYEDMQVFGSYIFYRAGIDSNGNWAFFVAGD